jgi:phosphoglycerate dehydrogenase-like enzyme
MVEAACDYAIVWAPPATLLTQLTKVKAIFLAGAGVDALLKFGDALPAVPIIRLGDAGMAVQMAEYVAHSILRYFRRFDDYERQARHLGASAAIREAGLYDWRARDGQTGQPRARDNGSLWIPTARVESHTQKCTRR